MTSSNLTLTNTSGQPLQISFQPWGMPHELAPGYTFNLEFKAEDDSDPQVEFVADGVIVWAWPTATLMVTSNGDVVEHFSVPVPSVPSGMSVATFLKTVQGKSASR